MELRLILGDQLNLGHSWFIKPRSDITYVLMQIRTETDYCLHHCQKVIGFFMAMEAFTAALKAQGHQVVLITIDAPNNKQSFSANLQQLIAELAQSDVEVVAWRYQAPDEYRLDDLLRKAVQTLGLPCQCDESEHFLCSRDGFSSIYKPQTTSFRMETFYRTMRKRHGVLLDSKGQPEAGAWNFDHDNRGAYDQQVNIPEPLRFSENQVNDWPERLQNAGVKTMGEVDEFLDWPIHRKQSLALLDYFIAKLLPHFGRYQDALLQHHDTLFHSRLSFALNVKMLHPKEVIDAVEQAYRQGQADIAACEGFIRQILGWREYVRCFYWQQYPAQAHSNALGHQRAMPSWFWTGETKMACLQRAISQSLTTAYAHHIQRLMVTGNFLLLTGVDPAEVNAWYLGIYVDAIEWVQWPNTHAMSQFAEGGTMASKPYISSGAYINKQGDHCRHCHYNVKQKVGVNACPFNSLYWNFIDRHEALLKQNPRMALITAQWAKQSEDNKQATRQQAQDYLIDIEAL